MKITVDMMMYKHPCSEYSRERVADLWAGREALTLTEICDLDIPAQDRIWAVTRFLPNRENRLFACDCAQAVAHLNTDHRVQAAIDVARRYAVGEATDGERDAARAAAWDDAWAAAWDAARAAERDAAGDAQIKTLRDRCERIDDEAYN